MKEVQELKHCQIHHTVHLDDDIVQLYKECMIPIYEMVHAEGGNREAAKDVLQESILVFLTKKKNGSTISNDKAYLYTIARNYWYSLRKSSGKRSGLNEDIMDFSDEPSEKKMAGKEVMEMLEMAGQKCMNLLIDFYIHSVPIADVTRKFGFKNKHTASVRKYKCLQKLRNFVQSKSLSYEDFTR